MSSFNFKSVGKKIDDRKFVNIEKSKKQLSPIGLKTPLQIIVDSEDLYQTHVSPEKQIKDNIKNFLLTNNGERLGKYNFGANLKTFCFESSKFTREEFIQEIYSHITNKINKYFTAVSITDLKVDLKMNNEISEVKQSLEQLTFHKRNFISKDPNVAENNPSGIGKVVILMTFAIPAIKITNQKIEVTIFVGG